jgi:hypothetical protein
MGTSILLVHWGEDAARFRDPLRIAMSIVSRRHFLGSYKDEAEGMFQEGQRLYGEQRFSEAAERWGRAALLQHAPSHAHLSNMLQEGRPGLPSDHPRSFQLASAGAAMGCAHSMGVLSQCLVTGVGVAVDRAQGLALARHSAAAGSLYGQFVVGLCTHVGWEVARDYSEAARLCVAYLPPPPLPVLLSLSAFRYELAAAQGHSVAQCNLGVMFDHRQVDTPNRTARTVRLWQLAAAQGHSGAQFNLGVMYETGRGVARDLNEAARWYQLAAQGQEGGEGREFALKGLRRLGK